MKSHRGSHIFKHRHFWCNFRHVEQRSWLEYLQCTSSEMANNPNNLKSCELCSTVPIDFCKVRIVRLLDCASSVNSLRQQHADAHAHTQMVFLRISCLF